MRVKKKRDTLVESYYLYSKDNINAVSLKEYKTICYSFNKEIARLIVEEGIIYKMPYNLGSIGIKRRKMKFQNLKFDFQHWKLTGETSFHLNQHSKEWYSFCHWRKKDCRVKGKKVYRFTLSRDNKRVVAKVMQTENGYQTYQESESNTIKNKIKKRLNGI